MRHDRRGESRGLYFIIFSWFSPLGSFPRLNLCYILVILLLQFPVNNAQANFFRSLFRVPDHCSDDGIFSSCTFLVRCLYDGGTPHDFCGGGFLYTCCALPVVKPVATVRSDVSNDIGVFNFFKGSSFSENLDFRPRLRMFSRSPGPPPISPSRRIPWTSQYIPVRIKRPSSVNSINKDFRSRHYSPSIFNENDEPYQDILIKEVRYYNEPECGIQQTKEFAKRIIGGNEAKFAELPWQAHIRISGYQCGGVLVNRYFVVTAAHCVHKARLNQITIHLGEYDTKDTGDYYEPYRKETFAVVDKRTHPKFKYMLTQPDRFDVAVLRLSRPAPYRKNIIPICLPSPIDDFEGMNGIVAGWGKTDTSFGKTGTNILRKVTVPVINNKECLRWHHIKGIDVKLHYEMFCAGHSQGNMDACLGDSGGPLVIFHKGRWKLAGITSAGFGCAVDHQPGIYHKVSVTSGWIAANVRP